MKKLVVVAAVLGLFAIASCSRNNDRSVESASNVAAKDGGGGSSKDGGVPSGALGAERALGDDTFAVTDTRDAGAASPSTHSAR
jgi:hypothetical protein